MRYQINPIEEMHRLLLGHRDNIGLDFHDLPARRCGHVNFQLYLDPLVEQRHYLLE